ncbi:amino acid ABC transporter permease [Amycolatopsis minnesotensis]|uniref:Amino acid ABC transporter permease n=1 Tax=Amycolatopsis minnesotensis TaxID=337894 RepID=A0ABN2Q0Q7_9PSEU
MSQLTESLGDFGDGLLTTVELAGASFLGAVVVALVVVTCRIVPVRPLRLFGTAYVELFQSIPLLLWLALVFFALPEIGVEFSGFASVVLASSLYQGSYYAEAIRTGVNSVSKGQAEAARALGMSTRQLLTTIVLPQAFRTTVQPLTNVTITLVLETALAATVGLLDLTEAANRINFRTAEPILVYTGAGLCYAAMAVVISTIGGRLERKMVIHR